MTLHSFLFNLLPSGGSATWRSRSWNRIRAERIMGSPFSMTFRHRPQRRPAHGRHDWAAELVRLRARSCSFVGRTDHSSLVLPTPNGKGLSRVLLCARAAHLRTLGSLFARPEPPRVPRASAEPVPQTAAPTATPHPQDWLRP
jgi:hypothetical protein